TFSVASVVTCLTLTAATRPSSAAVFEAISWFPCPALTTSAPLEPSKYFFPAWSKRYGPSPCVTIGKSRLRFRRRTWPSGYLTTLIGCANHRGDGQKSRSPRYLPRSRHSFPHREVRRIAPTFLRSAARGAHPEGSPSPRSRGRVARLGFPRPRPPSRRRTESRATSDDFLGPPRNDSRHHGEPGLRLRSDR